MISTNASEQIAVIATLDPVSVVNSEVFTDACDLSKFNQVMAILSIGVMADEGIVLKGYYCDSAGNNATALKTKTIVHHTSNNDATQQVMVIRGDELNAIAETTRYVKFGVATDNSAGGIMSIVVLGIDPRAGLASSQDLSSVAGITA